MAPLIELQEKKNSVKINNPSQQENYWHISTWTHRACFAAGCASVLISISKSLLLTSRASTSAWPWLATTSAALIGYVAADLTTGIYHWAVDNYGSPKTPFFGPQIEPFVGHHQQPWSITKRQLANNLHIPAIAVAFLILPVNVFSGDPTLLGFFGTFMGCIMFSQLFHAWAHTPKGKLPAVVAALQDAGVIVGRAEHAAHHRPPYNSSYCIVSGLWNKALDRLKFFVALEVVVFWAAGYRPRSWGGPGSEWAVQPEVMNPSIS